MSDQPPRKRRKRDHPEVQVWDEIALTARECHRLAKLQWNYVQLLQQIGQVTKHRELTASDENAARWNASYKYNAQTPEEISGFVNEWWKQFIASLMEEEQRKASAIEDVKRAASGSVDDITRAALRVTEVEATYQGTQQALRRWARIVRAPKDFKLQDLGDIANQFLTRWTDEWARNYERYEKQKEAFATIWETYSNS